MTAALPSSQLMPRIRGMSWPSFARYFLMMNDAVCGDGSPWTVGLEIQFDGPAGDPFDSLLPTGRFALGIRRAF